jgi:hypothetical protein
MTMITKIFTMLTLTFGVAMVTAYCCNFVLLILHYLLSTDYALLTGTTSLCGNCGNLPARGYGVTQSAPSKVFWFEVVFSIEGEDHTVRLNSVSGPQLLKTTALLWSSASNIARDELFAAVSDRFFTLVIKVTRYQNVVQMMCTSAKMEPIEVSSFIILYPFFLFITLARVDCVTLYLVGHRYRRGPWGRVFAKPQCGVVFVMRF